MNERQITIRITSCLQCYWYRGVTEKALYKKYSGDYEQYCQIHRCGKDDKIIYGDLMDSFEDVDQHLGIPDWCSLETCDKELGIKNETE